MATLNTQEIIVRLLLAFAAGLVLGWERESRGRPAGLRTTILACVAAAVSMIVSEALFIGSGAVSSSTWRPDPARLGAGVLTGIGFLGAGTIIRHENFIRGVTTAATLWLVTVLGLAFGSGQYLVGSLGVAIAIATLYVLPALEKHIPADYYATLEVRTRMGTLDEADLQEWLQQRGCHVLKMKLEYDSESGHRRMECDLRLRRSVKAALGREIVAGLAARDGVLLVKWA